jgi:hypothetical protein
LDLNSRGPNHGIYRKNFEADAFKSIVTHVETDKELTKKKVNLETQSMKASKVITKFNENSHRVLGFSQIVRQTGETWELQNAESSDSEEDKEQAKEV